MCNERFSHRATDSVRKGIGILPHSSPLPRKLRYGMYHPGGACRGKDLPPGRILYIYTLLLLNFYIVLNRNTEIEHCIKTE